MTDLYRLVYASKNLLQGTEAEAVAAIQHILEASQRNNLKVGVTGALMFNDGAFAQVLEGPRRGVEETFERIQRDLRHGDVTVLQCGPTETRGFTNWSMAFVGQSAQGRARFSKLEADSGFDLSRLSGDSVFAMLHELVLEEEGVPVAASSVAPAMPVEAAAPSSLDVKQIRAEIAELRPAKASAHAVPASQFSQGMPGNISEEAPRPSKVVRRPTKAAVEVSVAVLKAALASERQRTTELRSKIDDLEVALAASTDQLDALRDERNLWAERARLLAMALSHEASNILDAVPQTDTLTTKVKLRDRSAA